MCGRVLPLPGVYGIPDSPGQEMRKQPKGRWVAEGREAPQEGGGFQVRQFGTAREGSSRDSELGGERSSAGSEETHGALVFIPVPVTKRLPRARLSLSLLSKLGSHEGCWICGSVGAQTVRAGRGERSCTEDMRRWGQGGGRRSRRGCSWEPAEQSVC